MVTGSLFHAERPQDIFTRFGFIWTIFHKYYYLSLQVFKNGSKYFNFHPLIAHRVVICWKYCWHQGLKGGTHIICRKLLFLCFECISRNLNCPNLLVKIKQIKVFWNWVVFSCTDKGLKINANWINSLLCTKIPLYWLQFSLQRLLMLWFGAFFKEEL